MELTTATVCIYFDHAFRGIHRVLDRLDDSSVNQRPHGPSTNSVAALVVHCCGMAPFWLEHVGLGLPTDRDRDAEFVAEATIGELRDAIDELRARCEELLGRLETSASATYHERRVELPGGDRSDASVVLHVLEELYQHLGHMEITADALTA